jgi:hypothetical protein
MRDYILASKMSFKAGCLCLFVLFTSIWCRAQSTTTPRSPTAYTWENSLIPPSPEAAALSKVDLTTTVTATGRTPFFIPLYSLNAGGLTIPVQLAYTGGNGIRVNEVASAAGLGWILDAGGAISVTVHGLPDLRQGAYQQHHSFHAPLTVRNALTDYLSCDNSTSPPDPVVQSQYDYALQVDTGLLDSQPDEYNLKIPGLQTAFTLDSTGACHTIPHSNLQISLVNDAINGLHFEAVDVQGTRFYFTVQEGSSLTTIRNGSLVRPSGATTYTSAFVRFPK